MNRKYFSGIWLLLVFSCIHSHAQNLPKTKLQNLLPADWNPKKAADSVLARLMKVTAPEVVGAHDASLVVTGGRAYVVSMVNDVRPSENPIWPEIYVTLSIVNLKTMKVEKIIPYGKGGTLYGKDSLPVGACFVPRVLLVNEKKLRFYFASEHPGQRQSQVWFRDFNTETSEFETRIHKVKIKTASGIFDMQPQYFYADARAKGFTKKEVDFGVYMIDGFKTFDGKTYAVLNNYPGGQNSLALVHDQGALLEVLGHYNLPDSLKLTESSVNKLPDGDWMAICRQEDGNRNYVFATSRDGKNWTSGTYRGFVQTGTNSKPTFNKFRDAYYLGWQDSATVNGVFRSVFNIDVSKDAIHWERKYRFETDKSFQYPSFVEYKGSVWLTVTQGDADASRKERIMFGRLEYIR